MIRVINLANLDNVRLFLDENSCSKFHHAWSSIVVRLYVEFSIQSEVWANQYVLIFITSNLRLHKVHASVSYM